MIIEPGSDADGNANMSSAGSVLVRTAHEVTQALAEVRSDLIAKREQRNALNDEIRQLVADEDRLRRAARLFEGLDGNGS